MGGAVANDLARDYRPRTSDRVYFPGESARASLKRQRRGRWHFQSAHFPGESARASLKLDDPPGALDEMLLISRANQPGPH